VSTPIDWEQLAREVGSLREDGEHCSSDLGLRALEVIVGEDRLRAAVDYYVAGGRGSELARFVLWALYPWSAMCRCYEIYRSDADVATRCSAVELLRVVGDRRALPWVSEFLDDQDPGIQAWGAGMLDQLLWSRLVFPEECEELLKKCRAHPNEQVRETADFIDSYLASRGPLDAGPSPDEQRESPA